VPSIPMDLSFPHRWKAEVLASRPPILPLRRYLYPARAEEVEHGALEILVRPGGENAQPFLATCALGFRDPLVPTGVWSCPSPSELCAVSGGYAYLLDTAAPERFTMLAYRPVLAVRSLPVQGLLVFVGHHGILAWGAQGEAWQSERLSDEGVTITDVDGSELRGTGWHMVTDKETQFAIDLTTGHRLE
jgi:hypothetical protein